MNFKKFFVRSAVVATMFVSSMSVQAGLLTFNGEVISALDLNGAVSSFEEFYDYDNAKKWSSNTGLEIADKVVLFVAELNNEYAIFSTISNTNGGSAGALSVSYLASAGSMLFMDDPDEVVGVSGISFAYAANRNDGFIFAGLDDATWSFNLSLTNPTNVTGVSYVSFTDGLLGGATFSQSLSLDSSISIANTVSSSANPVNAPATAALFLLGLGLISFRNRKAR